MYTLYTILLIISATLSAHMEKGTPDKHVGAGGGLWRSIWFFAHCYAFCYIFGPIPRLHHHISTISHSALALPAETLYDKVCNRIHQPLPREQALSFTSVVYLRSMTREKSREHSRHVLPVGHCTPRRARIVRLRDSYCA
jgi:hypothetical protein